ncbi:MAG: hypothetical protein ABH829_03910 [archaeon]
MAKCTIVDYKGKSYDLSDPTQEIKFHATTNHDLLTEDESQSPAMRVMVLFKTKFILKNVSDGSAVLLVSGREMALT